MYIYYFERNKTFSALARTIFGYVEENQENVTLCTSGVTLVEALIHPLRNGRTELVDGYKKLLLSTQGVQLIHLNTDGYLSAALLRAKYNLRTPDALQLGASIQHGCEVFITNDRRLKRVSEINVLVLADYV
ncbi:MAG: PIN domain-containing protein [Caldilineaceae bacterium]|nr:PIN domain-containing protein [Caldilineaceae bacterium]